MNMNNSIRLSYPNIIGFKGNYFFAYDVLLPETDTVIGEISLALAQDTGMPPCIIDNLKISKAYRNKGYGTSTLLHVQDIYGKGNCAIAPYNEKSVQFCKRLGTDITPEAAELNMGYGVYGF